MAKKTNTTTTRKGRTSRSSGSASRTKGNSNREGETARTKSNQAYNNQDDYSNSSGYSKGNNADSNYYDGDFSSNVNSSKSDLGNRVGYSSESFEKDNYSNNDNYDSHDSNNGSNTKERYDYSDDYNDSNSSTKEDLPYDDNYNNRALSSNHTSKENSGYSYNRYENDSSTEKDNTHNDNGYRNDDSYDSGNGKYEARYSNNEPINDPPPYDDYEDEVIAKTPNSNESRRVSKYDNNEGEADTTFTEDKVYVDRATNGDGIEGNNPSGPLSSITETQINRVKRRLHIPENGFLVDSRRGTVRKNVEVSRINELLERLENREIAQHVQDTINLFIDETDRRSHQDRNQIDIPLILAIAIRESGVELPISRRRNRIVSAGRDAHSLGRSGLDWIYDKKRSFPSAIRNQVRPVRDNPAVGGEFRRPNVTPAFLRERDLLAAFVVEINIRSDRFLRFFNQRVFANGFNDNQRAALLRNLSHDAKRAWIQAAFGSKLLQLLEASRSLIQGAIASGASFDTIVLDSRINLNAIITNDDIMPTNLSRQRTRISAAEALLLEEALGNRF